MFAFCSKLLFCGRTTQKRCPVGASMTTQFWTLHALRTELLEPHDLGLDVVGLDVEMHAALVIDGLYLDVQAILRAPRASM